MLIVDDDPGQLQLLELVLQPLNLDLHLAISGDEALEKARAIIPDLVLLDVMLPDLDGFHVCRELRQDPILAEVPIILVTAIEEKRAFLRGMDAGADDFITKPFDALLLRTRVQTITRLNRYRGLRLERSKFHWVVEHSDEGYVVLSDNLRVVYANSRAQEMLGAAVDAEVDADVIPPSFLDVAQARYQTYPDGYWSAWPLHASQRGPGYLIQPESDGKPAVWLQVDLLEIPPREGERYFIRLRDVTHAIHENRLMWSFQDIVSHKFQTPLSLIEGFLETLEDSRLDDGQRKLLLNTAMSNVRRLQQEISSMYRYLGATTLVDRGPITSTAEDLLHIFRRVRTDLEIGRVHVRNAVEEQDSGWKIPLAPQELESIFRELLQNAVKFHPEHRPAIALTIEEDNGSVRLQLEDDGPGLPPAQMERMWVPYYQAEEHFYGETPGLGLGLATVASVVASVGGSCRSRSGSRGGLLIELEIPVVDEDEVDRTAAV